MDSDIIDQLIRRAAADQKMRNDAIAGKAQWNASVDKENTEFLRKVIKAHGWPGISSVGHEVAHAAWTLAQHADHDPAFQTHCLELMKSLPEDEVSSANIAYLEDRVRVNHGLPQLYGTQFYKEGELFGPRPIE